MSEFNRLNLSSIECICFLKILKPSIYTRYILCLEKMWYSIQIESFPLVLLVRRDKYSTCDILCLFVYDIHPEYFSEISINICKCLIHMAWIWIIFSSLRKYLTLIIHLRWLFMLYSNLFIKYTYVYNEHLVICMYVLRLVLYLTNIITTVVSHYDVNEISKFCTVTYDNE